jgi:hypothetical protein
MPPQGSAVVLLLTARFHAPPGGRQRRALRSACHARPQLRSSPRRRAGGDWNQPVQCHVIKCAASIKRIPLTAVGPTMLGGGVAVPLRCGAPGARGGAASRARGALRRAGSAGSLLPAAVGGSSAAVFSRPRRAPGAPRRVTSASASAAAAVSFSVTKHVRFGQTLRVVGSLPELGAWDPAKAPELTWGDGDVWTGAVALPPGAEASYKFVVYRADGSAEAEWEDGDDRRVTGSADGPIAVTVEFGRGDSGRRRDKEKDKERNRRSDKGGDSGGNNGGASVAPSDELVLAMAGADGRWQGKEVTFMRSNDHSGARRGAWKPEGLNGAAKALVDGDMCAPRARQRGGARGGF